MQVHSHAWYATKCKICFKTKAEHTLLASAEEIAAAAATATPSVAMTPTSMPLASTGASLLSPRLEGSAGNCKFVAQLFSRTKCKLCFKSRENHQYFAEESPTIEPPAMTPRGSVVSPNRYGRSATVMSPPSLLSPTRSTAPVQVFTNLTSPSRSSSVWGRPMDLPTPRTLYKETGIDERAENASDTALMEGLNEADQAELRMLLEEERLLTLKEQALEEKLKQQLAEEEAAAQPTEYTEMTTEITSDFGDTF